MTSSLCNLQLLVKGSGTFVFVKGGCVFTIDLRRNTRLVYFADISRHSTFPDEEEVLFYPYSSFKLVEVNHESKEILLQPVGTILVEV